MAIRAWEYCNGYLEPAYVELDEEGDNIPLKIKNFAQFLRIIKLFEGGFAPNRAADMFHVKSQ